LDKTNELKLKEYFIREKTRGCKKDASAKEEGKKTHEMAFLSLAQIFRPNEEEHWMPRRFWEIVVEQFARGNEMC